MFINIVVMWFRNIFFLCIDYIKWRTMADGNNTDDVENVKKITKDITAKPNKVCHIFVTIVNISSSSFALPVHSSTVVDVITIFHF